MFGFTKRAPVEEQLADVQCAFCRQPRAAVRSLVATAKVAICDQCAVLSVAALEESHDGSEDSLPIVVSVLAQVVGSTAIAEPRAAEAMRVALELAKRDAASLRLLGLRALEAERHAMSVQAFERIPTEELVVEDRLCWSGCLWYCRAFEEGLALLDGLESDDLAIGILLTWNRAAFLLRLQSELDEAFLARTVRELHLGVVRGFFTDPEAAATKAECLTRLGRHSDARDVLESKRRVEPLTGLDEMILGDVAMALGDQPLAMEHYTASTELGGVTADEVALRIAQLSPYR